MKIGIRETAYLENGKINYKKMKAHGYDYADFQGFLHTDAEIFSVNDREFKAKTEEKRREIESAGIKIYQTHAPWPTDDLTEESRKKKLVYMKRAIFGTSLLGGECFVVHPVMPFGWEEKSEEESKAAVALNEELFTGLCDFAKDFDVKICIENMPALNQTISPIEKIAQFCDNLGKDNLYICLDTGHANVFGTSCGDAVRLCKNRLACLHIHDNNGEYDQHKIPFEGTIDWSDFKKAIHDTGFPGVVSLETGVNPKYPENVRDEALKMLAETAKFIAKE